MHGVLYAINLFSEINQLRQQYKENKYDVFYFSKAVSSIELFIEFFFELIHERCEPLIAVIEFAKCILRFREYRLLVGSERINTYIDMEAYHEHKRLKEIKDAHFTLVRTQKRLPKIKNFKLSHKLE